MDATVKCRHIIYRDAVRNNRLEVTVGRTYPMHDDNSCGRFPSLVMDRRNVARHDDRADELVASNLHDRRGYLENMNLLQVCHLRNLWRVAKD